MDVRDAIQARKSCRDFIDTAFMKQSDIDLILEAGKRAPYASGGPRRAFKVVKKIGNLLGHKSVTECCNNQKHVRNSAVLVVVSGTDIKTKLQSGFPKFVHDCDAAMTQMILQATELDVGNCWIGHFSTPALQKVIGEDLRPVAVLALGLKRRGM